MDTKKLRPDTARAWELLRTSPLLNGFVLIGGTALTLRIGHRLSEDLDFAYTGAKLPRQRLAKLIQELEAKGLRARLNQSQEALDSFEDAGLELDDYQLNYLLDDTVKLSFVCLDPPAARVLKEEKEAPLRVASMDEIFALKALVCAGRSKTRDWFDLYILCGQHGYTFADLFRVYESLDSVALLKSASLRLRGGKPALDDEGYESLLEQAPTLEQMRAYFTEQLDALEIRLAEVAFRAQHSAPDAQ